MVFVGWRPASVLGEEQRDVGGLRAVVGVYAILNFVVFFNKRVLVFVVFPNPVVSRTGGSI